MKGVHYPPFDLRPNQYMNRVPWRSLAVGIARFETSSSATVQLAFVAGRMSHRIASGLRRGEGSVRNKGIRGWEANGSFDEGSTGRNSPATSHQPNTEDAGAYPN